MVDLQANPLPQKAPDVHKFGGTSLQDAKRIGQVVDTIAAKVNRGDFLVVSANGRVTDYLYAIIQGDQQAWVDLNAYLVSLVDSVLEKPAPLLSQIRHDLHQLSAWTQQAATNQHDILALGELWSAQLLSAKLQEQHISNEWLDARDFLVIDDQNQLANRAIAKQQLQQLFRQSQDPEIDQGKDPGEDPGEDPGVDPVKDPFCYVITGFIARDLNGDGVTLGRNGSDYTATLMAELMQTDTVYLWTDVDGIYSADPNLIKQAVRVKQLTLCEAQALSELGSNVFHEKTIAPMLPQSRVRASHRPVRLEINTCNPKSNGTQVTCSNSATSVKASEGRVKTLAHKSRLVHLSVAPISELKARQLQASLTAAQIASYANHLDKTRGALGFYVNPFDLFKTTQLIKSAKLHITQQQSDMGLISAVGQNIRQNHRIISKILNRSARFDIHSIHYPANDHTLSLLLPDMQAIDLLQDLHDTLFGLEPSIPIVVLGYGNIGQQFLQILKQHKSTIEHRVQQSLSVVAVANSRYFLFSESCLLDESIELTQPNQQGELLEKLKAYTGKPLVVIDLTASDWVAEQYLNFAERGWHIIAANKVAAADHEWASQIEQVMRKKHTRWLTNTTVGAAMPIQDALHKLIETGDQVRSVSGVFSGSLSWLFGQYDGKKPFMDWVKKAWEQAYTEPDPRDDLSGQDVYRKALILARELGFKPSQIQFEPVIPAAFLAGTKEDFWRHQEAINKHLHGLWQQASQNNKQLRYLAAVSADALRVGLVAVDADHAAAQLQPGDNIFIVESDWYADNPLIIQGPGAGREVTAAGVLNDLIELLQSA